MSSHFLLMYTSLGYDFHIQSITEMLRVCKEIRIFPIVDLDANKTDLVKDVIGYFQKDYNTSIVTTDYDPEGLLIAQRMRNRYGERVHFWKYCAEYYQRYCSEKVIDDSRLQSLQGVVAEELQPVREAMLREKRAVYQEAMMEVYEL